MKPLLLAVIIPLFAFATQGARQPNPSAALPSYEVITTKDQLNVDGKLSEKAWAKAKALTLMFPWENQTGLKQKTTVKLLRDSQYLYIGYECTDDDITATHLNRDDPTYLDDCVEFFIRPQVNSNQYFGLEMNARGVLYDYLYDFPKRHDKTPDLANVQLKTTLRGTLNKSDDHDQGWALEVAIPWQSLQPLAPQPPRPGDEWRVQFNRWDGTEAKGRRLSMWCSSELEKPNPHNPVRFGKLIFR